MDPKGHLTYRFHRTDIIKVHANGDIKLTSGGWFTRTTIGSMNAVLKDLHIQVSSCPCITLDRHVEAAAAAAAAVPSFT